MRRLFRKFINGPIGVQITVYFSLLFAFVIVITTILAAQVYSNAFNEQVTRDTQKILKQTLAVVDYYFADVRTPIVMLARNQFILKSISKYYLLDWGDRLNLLRNLEEFTQNISTFKEYISDILVLGNNGFRYNLYSLSTDKMLNNYDFYHSEWFKEAAAAAGGIKFIGAHTTCDYYIHGDPELKVISALLPVKENEVQLGYILCDIDIRQMMKLFVNNQFEKDTTVFMVDNDAHIVFHSNPDKIGTSVDANLEKSIHGKSEGSFFWNPKDGDRQFVVYLSSDITEWKMIAMVPYVNMQRASRRFLMTNLTIIAGMMIVIALLSGLISSQVTKPLKQMTRRIETVKVHDFSAQDIDYGKGEVARLGRQFEKMVHEIDRLIKDVYLSQLGRKEAQLQLLQSKINPHFLYNSLQLIQAEAVCGSKNNIKAIVTALGYILRYSLEGQNEMVKLKDELKCIENYLEIYRMRLRQRFTYFIEADHDILNSSILKMIIQPAVENCITHGLANVKENGEIRISCVRGDDDILIRVWDNGSGIGAERLQYLQKTLQGTEPAVGIGLSNINERIQLKFGPGYGVAIRSFEGEFTEVTMRFPQISKEESA